MLGFPYRTVMGNGRNIFLFDEMQFIVLLFSAIYLKKPEPTMQIDSTYQNLTVIPIKGLKSSAERVTPIFMPQSSCVFSVTS